MGLVAISRKKKTKNVLLLKITLLMQCWRAYEQCHAPITPNKSPKLGLDR